MSEIMLMECLIVASIRLAPNKAVVLMWKCPSLATGFTPQNDRPIDL